MLSGLAARGALERNPKGCEVFSFIGSSTGGDVKNVEGFSSSSSTKGGTLLRFPILGLLKKGMY
tara:strand:- start:425 stop:616 length:192 start_codon:yes stop_codon:yes gene_type:complete